MSACHCEQLGREYDETPGKVCPGCGRLNPPGCSIEGIMKMSDHFPPNLRLKTEVFEKRLRLGARVILFFAILSACSVIGVIYIAGHFIVKFW